jgi:hypothetical protein
MILTFMCAAGACTYCEPGEHPCEHPCHASVPHEPCPLGCGWPTEDPYGGPCKRCWDLAPGGAP